MHITRRLARFARRSPYDRALTVRSYLGSFSWTVPHFGSDKTAYVIGLFGSGRLYVDGLIVKNIGKRRKYFRDLIRCHKGPTSMIYSGHATMKHISRAQAPPEVTSQVLDALKSGFADLIFVTRHPLDSLLTNWIWWRRYLQEDWWVSGISEVFKNDDEFSAELDRNFCEFEDFASGNPRFFRAAPGSPFLSFAQFVEETELFLDAASLTLRLEDFMVDPVKQFSKIVQVMSVDLHGILPPLPPPNTKPNRYLAVQAKVRRFSEFIDHLDDRTKRRMEKIGYPVEAARVI
jgi:hypothetical protein